MGLGLTIVERACALLGHRLDFISEPGTRHRLPGDGAARRERRRPARGEDALSPRGGAGPADRATVALVIENDEAVRLAMSTLLKGWGVGVLDMPGRNEALQLLEDIGIGRT